MPLPEGYLPREGDVLTVKVTVRHNVEVDESTIHVNPESRPYSNFTVALADAVSIISRHFEIGAKVRKIEANHIFGEVVAAANGMLWVRLETRGSAGEFETMGSMDVELNPDDVNVPLKPNPNPGWLPNPLAAVPLGGAHHPEPFCEPPPKAIPAVTRTTPDDEIPF